MIKNIRNAINKLIHANAFLFQKTLLVLFSTSFSPFFNDVYPDILFCLDTMISSGCITAYIHTMLCIMEVRSVDVGFAVQAAGVTQGRTCEPWRCQTYSAEI